jgi:hypothetical protein
MLRRLILARIASAEKHLGVPLDYCRFMVRVSPLALFKHVVLPRLLERHRVVDLVDEVALVVDESDVLAERAARADESAGAARHT